MQKYREQKRVLRIIPYLENEIMHFNVVDNHFPLIESRLMITLKMKIPVICSFAVTEVRKTTIFYCIRKCGKGSNSN